MLRHAVKMLIHVDWFPEPVDNRLPLQGPDRPPEVVVREVKIGTQSRQSIVGGPLWGCPNVMCPVLRADSCTLDGRGAETAFQVCPSLRPA